MRFAMSGMSQIKAAVPARRQAYQRTALVRKQPKISCSQASASSGGHAGHALLHDFCMTIPYGAITTIVGLVGLAMGGGQIAIATAVSGAVVSASSVGSLKTWKSGKASTPFTLVSAATATALSYLLWQKVKEGAASIPTYFCFALSFAAAIFSVYNMLAGGNPPKKTS